MSIIIFGRSLDRSNDLSSHGLNPEFDDTFQSVNRPVSVERNLVAAVMLRAICDITIPKQHGQALAWFKYSVDETYDDGFTFEQCCSHLGWEPKLIIQKVFRLVDWVKNEWKGQGKVKVDIARSPEFAITCLRTHA